MTFFAHALKSSTKFGKRLGKGVRKFGGEALHEAVDIEKFVEKKALPTIEKVSKTVGKGLKIAEVGASFVAPEALPFLIGLDGANKAIGKGLHTANKSIEIGHKAVGAVNHFKRGDVPQAILGGLEIRKQASGLENPFKK
jgi:hypothetical protein